MFMSDLSDGLEVRDVVLGVANALDVDRLSVLIDSGGKVFGLVTIDELGLDA